MQVMQQHSTMPADELTGQGVLMSMKVSEHFVVKEKNSSNGSLLLMNPVASGDNMASTWGLNTGHKEELPGLVPCCEGRELRLNEDLVRSGLSAISVRHDTNMACLSLAHASEKLQITPGLVKHRNSFRSLHRPDLKRVPYLRRMTPDELETVFHGYSDIPARCSDAKTHGQIKQSKISESNKVSAPVVTLMDQSNTYAQEDGAALLRIPESRSGNEDVPASMRLHGTRARLYTSILAGAKTGDQLEEPQLNEELDHRVHEDPLPEDEVQQNEELQIILPPRCDDATDSNFTTTTDMSSTSN